MPIYEYECNACGSRHEFLQKFSEGPKRKCPACGALRLRKLVSAAAFHLKGDGWYVTDFRDKDKKKKDANDDGKTASADGGKDGGKPDGKSDDKSPGKTQDTSDNKSQSKSDSGSSDAGSQKGAGKKPDKGASAPS